MTSGGRPAILCPTHASSVPRRVPNHPSTLVSARQLATSGTDALTVLEKSGSYSGRGVNFFRAFNPAHATAAANRVPAFADLDAYQEQSFAVLIQEPADRAAHADDQRLVFWEAEFARSSGLTLSEPTTVWLQAQSAATSVTSS